MTDTFVSGALRYGLPLEASLNTPFRPIDADLPVLILEADIALEGIPAGININLISSQDDLLGAIGAPGNLIGYHHFTLVADYSTQIYSVLVDGHMAFPPGFFWYGADDVAGILVLFGGSAPQTSGAIRIDNLSLRAVPSPPGSALAAFVAVSMNTRRRRRPVAAWQ